MKHQNSARRAHRKPSASTPKVHRATPPKGAFRLLTPELQRAVGEAGYTEPTPIQEQCIQHVLDGRDLIGSAQTGTGKTAAFVLPLLQTLAAATTRPRPRKPRGLILAPTRELAAQIGDSIRTYGRFTRLTHTTVFGGVGQGPQVKAMNRGVDILVATPGRLLDLMEQGHIELDEVRFFVLDEVDRMLDMGFIPDIKRVVRDLPNSRHTLFFSATMPPKMLQLAMTMVREPDPVKISITPDAPAVDRIGQKVFFVNKSNKNNLLLSVMKNPEIGKTLIFTQMKHTANKVVDRLRDAGIRGTAIHGNKSQAARTKALDGFKRNRFKVLVATDVAARGLDVDDITHVINYDLPTEAETYVHRIGRTARAGADGDAISFCTAEDRAYLRQIERLLGEAVSTDLEHGYHCEQAQHSTSAAPKNYGRGGGGNPRARTRGKQPGKRGRRTGNRFARR